MYTKPVTHRVEITKDEARLLLVEARISSPGKLDVYERYEGGLYRLFTLAIPNSMSGFTPDELLEYARQNIPDNLRFG